MSVDATLQTALTPIGLPVFPNLYTGDAVDYIVTNYTMLPVLHAGDRAGGARYLVQVHYFLPPKKNPNPIKTQICQALHAAGFTCPAIYPNNEEAGQHYVIECEWTDGGISYGDC